MNIRVRAAASANLAAVATSLIPSAPARDDPPNDPGLEVISTSNTRTVSPSSRFSSTAARPTRTKG
jgi:hypothetical protein